jgi:FMN-dependent NADH-azoreductase
MESSPCRSFSNKLLAEFTAQWQARHPGLPVVDRNVQSIAHVSYDELEAGRMDPTKHTPAQQAAYALA